MNKELHDELTKEIVSENGVLKFNFFFDAGAYGRIRIQDNQLEVEFEGECRFELFADVITIKINQTREIVTYLADVRNELMQMESAYDVVGE